MQYSLFDAVTSTFSASPARLSNAALYQNVALTTGLDLTARQPVGTDGAQHSTGKRAVRWIQQTLKQLGLAERIEGERGVWRLTATGKSKLTPAPSGHLMLACSTDLGIAIWGNHRDVFSRLDIPITLCLTSPPYPLAWPRAYGNPTEPEYVDFVCEAPEPIVRNLRAGGNIVLNISNDIFLSKSPARSLYRERLVIALHERLGLHKMDELVWHNPTKPPGPTYWSSITRVQLTATYEPVLWFTNDPSCVVADNRRVLLPHSEQQVRLMARGGERSRRSSGDGAYTIRPESFAARTEGRIPRNVLSIPHRCAEKIALAQFATSRELPVHGATMPLALADFLVRYLSAQGDLVVDPFAGWLTSASAAEKNNRRWIVTELMAEYARVGIERLRSAKGFAMGNFA